MRIYIENLTNVNLSKIEKFIKNKKINYYAYTDCGIFIYNEKSLQKIDFHDKPVAYIKNYSNKYDLILDDSFIKYGNIYNSLPYNHKLEEVIETTYSLRDKSFVNLIVESNNNDELLNFYLETKENIENLPIKEDICTLLSMIN